MDLHQSGPAHADSLVVPEAADPAREGTAGWLRGAAPVTKWALRAWAGAAPLARSRALRHLLLLAGYVAAGVIVTWPRAGYLSGRLPYTRDASDYVWDLWWMAHQVTRLGNPWYTHYLAAPLGTHLAYHTLMPLPGLLMTPVTLKFGPSVSYNLLSAACPGLLCYAMYRAARLWLPRGPGAFAAGAFFGLAPELCWDSWYEVNLALGALFLPLTLEAVVRLCRAARARQAAWLGLVLGAAMLTDQESAVMAALLAAFALLPWVLSGLLPARTGGLHARRRPVPCWRAPGWRVPLARLGLTGLAGVAALVTASPQLVSMAVQSASGDAYIPPDVAAVFYNPSGAGLVQMLAPSPELDAWGLHRFTILYHEGRPTMTVIGYGLTLSTLAVLGMAAAWRRRSAWLLALLWVGATAMALGSAPWLVDHESIPYARFWHGTPMSPIMPYTWFVRLPGLAAFREADRFTEIGLTCAAVLAGLAVGWVCRKVPLVLAVPVLAVLAAAAVPELGWSGGTAIPGKTFGAMPAALPALDGPIAADHSRSIVVDVPFGLRGGLPVTGGAFPPPTLVLATADGHPLADALVSRIPPDTLANVGRDPFYAGLMREQGGPIRNTPAQERAAGRDARRIGVGWVVVWHHRRRTVLRYLRGTGFRLSYQADGAWVYRPVPARRP